MACIMQPENLIGKWFYKNKVEPTSYSSLSPLQPEPNDSSHKEPVSTCLTYYYMDVPYAKDNTYNACEHDVPINLGFHTYLQQYHENDISHFLALPKVISTRKKKQQQPLLDFMKSKILIFVAYMQGCEELLTQTTAHQVEAKEKATEKEATRKNRQKEKK